MSNYVKQVWYNGTDGQTPLVASRLNHMEDGIDAAITDDELAAALEAQLASFHPVPGGGTTGQVLTKVTDASWDTHWGNMTTTGGGAVASVNNQTGDVVLNAASVGAAPSSHTHIEGDITGLSTDLAAKYTKPGTGIPKADLSTNVQNSLTAADNAIPATQKGTASGVATLDSTGKLTGAQLPAIVFSNYLGSAANQAAMLAITGNKGDWIIRTDLGTTWLITGTDTTQLSSWQQLAYPTAPVTSVFGRTGAVVGDKTDVGLGNVDNTSDVNKPISTATQNALNARAPIANPTFTGTVGGITKTMIGLGNVDNTSDANKSFTASQISDSTVVGRALLTAADAPTARAAISAATIGTTTGTAADAGSMASSLSGKAPLVDAHLTGVPTAPTATSGTSTTQLATTAFVTSALSGATAATIVNCGIVGWNVSTNSWPARPGVPNGPVLWLSPQSASAPRPSDMASWDAWLINPDAI